MSFQIIHNDICNMNTEAIVNAANSQLKMGGGACGTIFKAAGARRLQEACHEIGYCEVGEAVMTPGYNLKANFIIHTVGPIWKGGKCGEAELLENAYLSSLKLAKEHGIKSIAFPLIATGIYGYPKAEAVSIAISTMKKFLETEEMEIYLVVYDRQSVEISESLYHAVSHYINHYYENTDRCYQRNRILEEAMILQESMLQSDCMSIAKSSSQRSLEDLLHNLDETFSEMLLRLIDERGLTDVEVYKKANVDRKLFSKIRSSKDYTPKKTTALALAIGLELSLDETKDLLMKAGYALNMSQKSDVIIQYFIENREYDVFEINQTLFCFQQGLLGSV